MNTAITTALVLALGALHANAQQVASTAQATGAVAPPAPPVVDTHTFTVRDTDGRPKVSWTVKQRPSAAEYRGQVAESMARRQTRPDHDASKTVTTRIPGEEPATRTVTPAEEAYGRLFDPVYRPFTDPLMSYDGMLDPNDPALAPWRTGGERPPLLEDHELKRLFESWSPEHGFGEGRGD